MNNSFKYIMENFSRYWKRTFWKDEKGMGVNRSSAYYISVSGTSPCV